MVSMKMAGIFSLLSLAFLVAAAVPTTRRVGPVPELWLLNLWPATVYLVVALVYATNPSVGVMLLGKRVGREDADGALPLAVHIFFFPFFVVMYGVWFVRHTTCVPLIGEDPFNEVGDGVYVGRYPLRVPSEWPADCRNWVDLTAEFPARKRVARDVRYVCLPAMDCTLPEPADIKALAKEAAGWEGTTYVSCANGHGRSACFAALILLLRGEHATFPEAIAAMSLRRPAIHIEPNQERTMIAITEELRQEGLLPALTGTIARDGKGQIALSALGLQQKRPKASSDDGRGALAAVVPPTPEARAPEAV